VVVDVVELLLLVIEVVGMDDDVVEVDGEVDELVVIDDVVMDDVLLGEVVEEEDVEVGMEGVLVLPDNATYPPTAKIMIMTTTATTTNDLETARLKFFFNWILFQLEFRASKKPL